MTSGALYHLVVTLRVSFARGLCNDYTLFILDSCESPDYEGLSCFTSTFFVFDLAKPFLLFFPSAYGGGFYFWGVFAYDFILLVSSSDSSLSNYSFCIVTYSIILANPKSQILTTKPWPFIRTLAGLRSLCTILAEWRYFRLNYKIITHKEFDRV